MKKLENLFGNLKKPTDWKGIAFPSKYDLDIIF